MKKYSLLPVVLAIAALAGACSSTPKTTTLLDQARTDYQIAQGSPNVANYAALDLQQAGNMLEQANAAARNRDSDEKIDKLAYLAKQKVALTQELAKQKSAEADVVGASKQRDQMRLDQRTDEADRAKMSAAQATQSAEQSRQVALAAQADTTLAQRETLEAQAHAAQLQTQLDAQLADLAAKKTERGIIITLGDVLFGTDLARLNSNGMATAQKLASVLQQNPKRTVLIEGFTDSTGTASHNQELSERRANAVKAALMEQGVSSERVTVRGYGQSYPVAANDSAQSRQQNRRVEIVLSDDSGKTRPR